MATVKRTFEDFGIDAALAAAISAAFGITEPSEIQGKAIEHIIGSAVPPGSINNRGDVLIRSTTGSGKTLAFLLPIISQLLLHRRRMIERKPSSTRPIEESRSLGTMALIVVPTRELAAQTETVLVAIEKHLKGRDHWIVSGSLSGGDRRKSEKDRLRKGLHIVVGTPGRLLDHLTNTASWTAQVVQSLRWVILDEADRLLDMGFEKTVREIFAKIVPKDAFRKPQVILASATIDKCTEAIFGYALTSPTVLAQTIGLSAAYVPGPSLPADTAAASGALAATSSLRLEGPGQLKHFYLCPPAKLRLPTLLGFLHETFAEAHNPAPKRGALDDDDDEARNEEAVPRRAKVVIFTICCDTVDFLHSLFAPSVVGGAGTSPAGSKEAPLRPALLRLPAKVFKLHGTMEHKARMETFRAFTESTTEDCILFCTDVAARGLNLCNVTCIVQYEAPCDMSDYIHRAGRTARQNSLGKSVLFLMPSERAYVTSLMERGVSISKVRWDPLLHVFARTVKAADVAAGEAAKGVPSAATAARRDEDEADREAFKDVSVEVKKKVLAWLESKQGKVKADEEMLRQARTAFLSFVRAYATHASGEKDIFHIKRLHLGHLAATFLLDEEPKAMGAKEGIKLDKAEKAARAKGATLVRHKRRVSEFDAGDASSLDRRSSKRAAVDDAEKGDGHTKGRVGKRVKKQNPVRRHKPKKGSSSAPEGGSRERQRPHRTAPNGKDATRSRLSFAHTR